ncbi:MAG: acyl-CoA thioesterase [Nitrososphaerales archaeon]
MVTRRKDPIFKLSLRARFGDTDASGVVHYSKVLSYFEELEEQYFLEIGYGWPEQFNDGFCLARHELSCTYLSRIMHGDKLEAQMRIIDVGKSHLKYEFNIYNSTTNSVAASAILVVVAVDLKSWKKIDLPEKIRHLSIR